MESLGKKNIYCLVTMIVSSSLYFFSMFMKYNIHTFYILFFCKTLELKSKSAFFDSLLFQIKEFIKKNVF